MLDTAKLRAGIHGNLAAYRGGDLTVAVDRIIDAEHLMSLAADEIEALRAENAKLRDLNKRLVEETTNARLELMRLEKRDVKYKYESDSYTHGEGP